MSLLEDLLQLLHLERRERDPCLPLFPYFVCDRVIVKCMRGLTTCSHCSELIYNPFICPLEKQTNKNQYSLVHSVVAVGDSNLTSDISIERKVLKSQLGLLS